jgi:hypothetical protein
VVLLTDPTPPGHYYVLNHPHPRRKNLDHLAAAMLPASREPVPTVRATLQGMFVNLIGVRFSAPHESLAPPFPILLLSHQPVRLYPRGYGFAVTFAELPILFL